MFKEMRRIKNKMSDADALQLLVDGEHGTLGTISANGFPYTVIVNYVVYNDKIYFHSAKDGHKIDNINSNTKVSFSVVGEFEVIKSTFTTKYRSVTLFGNAKVISNNKTILYEFIKKYSDGFLSEGEKYIEESSDIPVLVEIEILHITGKERV